jgi:glycosyltransferase involved in cell wall biosynthesis
LGYVANKFVVLPNGFDLDEFRPFPEARISVREELGLPTETPLIGLVARFDPQKNHDGFIRAAGLLHQRCSHVHFLLVGEGVERENVLISQAIARADIGRVVHLMGLRHDVPRLTAALDIASLSSSWGEAFPNVVGEAMACGVPCVVTDVGDSAEIVGDTGVVVATEDPEALARAWEGLLVIPRRERVILGERARARVASHFELGLVAKRYEGFYDRLLADAHRRKD